MRIVLLRGCAAVVSMSLLVPQGFAQNAAPPPLPAAQPAPPAGSQPADTSSEAASFNAEQLDALLAPIALYPDQLLVQVLMASTYPLDIVAASRWLKSGNNSSLTGDALAKALELQNWDPSVKSLVPFPQVLDMMNQQLEWTQQLGYAVSTQQDDVMDSVQRLRLQAQQAGTLKSNEQQVVSMAPAVDVQGEPTPQQAIIIQPANPQVVYVPTYNPSVVFGTWPYPSTPPVYFPPPPGYNFGNALLTGMAFATGVAVVGSLWGWATPRWGWGGGWYGGGGGSFNRYGGSINVNRNRYNNITVNNVNRGNFNGNTWRPSANGPGRGAGARPPGGPVGRPARGNGLPPNAIGRPNVRVPSDAVNRPNIGQGGGNRPNLGQGGGPGGGNRPNTGQGNGNRPNIGQGGGNRPNVGQGGGNRPNIGQGGAGGGNRPNVGQGGGNRPNVGQGGAGGGNRPNVGQGGGNRPNVGQPGGGNRPNVGQGVNRPGGGAASAPRPTPRPATRPSGGGAFGGVSDGNRAAQFQQRGAQSRNIGQSRPAPQAGAAAPRGGGGGGRPGGGGGGRPGGGGGGGHGGGGGRHR